MTTEVNAQEWHKQQQATIKTLLVYAVMGIGLPSESFGEYMAEQGVAKFTGNQHNPMWEWRQDKLERMTQESLAGIFDECIRLKQERSPVAEGAPT